MNDREKMLQKVRMYGFAMLDNGLFLNGHPRDASALAYQKKTKRCMASGLPVRTNQTLAASHGACR